MAQPTPYEPDYDFSDYQSTHPSDPLPGDKVDIELAAIQLTTDEILENLALIQRDDGALANNSVGIDQLKAEVDFGFNSIDDWETDHDYVVRDGVYFDRKIYRCIESHTSDTFSTDLAAEKWLLVVDFDQFLDIAETAATNAAASATAAASSATTASTAASTATTAANTAVAAAAGIKYKAPVACATTANITLSGEQTLDGVLTSASRVLVKNQSTASQNGIYVSAAGAWSRATDGDAWDELVSCAVPVIAGTVNGDRTFICTSDSGGTLGSTNVVFADWSTALLDGTVTNAKLANMAAATIKGSVAGGVPADLTATQVTALLNALVGDSGSGGTKGLVPAPASGDAAAGKFLKADGTWATATTTVHSFSASTTNTTNIPDSGAFTKIPFATEHWDTGGWYDNATNYRYTPQVAGKYCVKSQWSAGSMTDGQWIGIHVYKNGSLYKSNRVHSGSTAQAHAPIDVDVDMNGSTDYIEIFASTNNTRALNGVAADNWFQAHYIGA